MRVVFAGHTGIDKDVAVGHLKRLAISRLRIPDDPRHLYVDGIEDQIARLTGASRPAFLRSFNEVFQVEAWSRAMSEVLGTVQRYNSDHVFLSMHFTLYVDSRLFSLVDISTVQRFSPDCIVTLIDDIFDVWGMIDYRDRRDNTKFRLRLREIIAWRSMEIAFGELLSRFLSTPERPVPHYVVGVKHPAEMLYRLLFSDSPRFYASFPITATRGSTSSRQEIDFIRETLHGEFTVFDPLAIDEDVPVLFERARTSSAVRFTADDPSTRWPCRQQGSLAEGRTYVYPFDIPSEEIIEIEDDVGELVRVRDYGLINKVHCVAGYRPNYGGQMSKGMFAEFNYATNVPTPPKDLHFFFPPEDEGTGHPFTAFSEQHDSLEKWLTVLRNYRPVV